MEQLESCGFQGISNKIYVEWFNTISLCNRYERDEDEVNESNFFKTARNILGSALNKTSKAEEYLKSTKHSDLLTHIKLLNEIEFKITSFDLDKFLHEDQKMCLITKEITILQLLSTLIQALSLCYVMKIPHGNISPQTIFKKGKLEWELSPPIYSTINLEKRSQITGPGLLMKNKEVCIEFCMAPEIMDFKEAVNKCKFN